jgi:hypothetical protein
MQVIPIRTRQVLSKSRRQAHAIVFELQANRKLTSETARLQRIRPSGGIDSAHAGVSNKPRATTAAKHSWTQNAAKWFDRDEVRSREPRHAADVDSPVQTVPVRAAHQGSADEAVDSPVAGFTKCFSRKLIMLQDPKVAIQSTWRYFGVASVAFRQAFQK